MSIESVVRCFKFIPRSVHVREALVWLAINTFVVVVFRLQTTFKALFQVCRKEARNENDRPISIWLRVVVVLGSLFSFISCTNCAETSRATVSIAAALLVLCVITDATTSLIISTLSVPFLVKCTVVGVLSSADYAPLVIVVCLSLINLGARASGISKVLEVKYSRVLCSWLVSQVTWTVLLVLSFLSKINVDMMLCPSPAAESTADWLFGGLKSPLVSSPYHSYRSLLTVLVCLLSFVVFDIVLSLLQFVIGGVVGFKREKSNQIKQK